MAERKLVVQIIGDASSLERALGKASGSFSRLAKVGVGVATAGLAGLAATLKVGFDEFAESDRVSAQTRAVLRSTGGAAKVTAKEIESLAGSLSHMSGVDDELIQSGQNLLLTFTNIRNAAGKGNDVFNQTTRTMLDMSVALGQDMKSSAIQLGKALNDPIKGITALQRVGVSFTQDQRAQIKALVDSGKTMQAQKLILAELNREFGGSAKAFGETLPGQLDKLKVAFQEMAGAVFATLVPALMQLLNWVNANMPTIQRVIQTALMVVSAAIRALYPVIAQLIRWFADLARFAAAHWNEVRAAADRVVAWYRTNVAPAMQNIFAVLQAIWARFGDAITNITRTSLGLVLANVRTFLGNIASVVQAILAVLRGDWGRAWAEIAEIPRRSFQLMVTTIKGFGSILLEVAKAVGAAIVAGMREGISAAWGGLTSWVRGKMAELVDLIKRPWRIFSPSQVTIEIGRQIGAGLGIGIERGSAELPGQLAARAQEAVAAATRAIQVRGRQLGGGLSQVPAIIRAPGSAGPELVAPRMSGGGRRLAAVTGGTTINVFVSGSVVTERDLVATLRNALVREGRRQGGNLLGGLT